MINNLQSVILDELKESSFVLEKFLNNPQNIHFIEAAAIQIVDCISKGGKIISCGNGGSCCDAIHFAEELSGRYRNNREPIAALSISDPGHITCVANDYGYNEVFSRYVQAIGNAGDVLLAISTSGNSENILKAIELAKSKNMVVIGLSGKDGGKMKQLCDNIIIVEHFGFADRIQEVHIKIIHILILLIEKMLLQNVG
jgi:D-sedoheptulose 7-phosphate isomerase